MAILKVSTAYTRLLLMVQASDHVTGLTGQNGSLVVKLSKAGGAFANAAGTTAEVGFGWYTVALTTADTGTLGELGYHCTATLGDPTDFKDEVQAQVFTDLNLQSGTGRVMIANSLQQTTALNGFTFPMTNVTTGQRQPGLTVTAQRTLGAGGFAPAASSVGEVGGSGTTGIYFLNLAAGDLASPSVGLLFTASGANDVYIPLYPTP